MTTSLPTIERLHKLFRLDAETGKLFWRTRPAQCVQIGNEVGFLAKNGYRRVGVNGRTYTVHHIVFAMTHGRWPADQIDHINMVKDDNRPCNLREATNSQNMCNTDKKKNNTSGVKGVSWCRREGKWWVSIRADNTRIGLGYHDDLDLAALIYSEAARKYHGEFARASR